MSDRGSDRFSGVRAAETTADILQALADSRGPLSLTELSERSGLAPAKAHRYLASLAAKGIVVHRRSGLYDLGGVAADIGLAALARFDVVNHYADLLPGLVDEAHASALLAVWTADGPSVVRWERHAPMLVYLIGAGARVSTLRSAVGRAFVAHLPNRLVTRAIARELGVPEADVIVNEHRHPSSEDGLFRVGGDGVFGFASAARPILDGYSDAKAVIAFFAEDPAELAVGTRAAEALRRLR